MEINECIGCILRIVDAFARLNPCCFWVISEVWVGKRQKYYKTWSIIIGSILGIRSGEGNQGSMGRGGKLFAWIEYEGKLIKGGVKWC